MSIRSPRPSKSRARSASRARKPAIRSRPGVEALEGRVVLSISVSSSTWTPIGPSPIDGIQPTGVGNGAFDSGRITAVAADPTNANILYLASAGGGVWKSTDAGLDWSPLTDNQSTLFMGSLAVSKSNPQVIYAGTGEANNSGDSFYGEGVLKSTDGGATWTQEDNGGAFDRRAIAQIAIDPTNANVVYAAISTGPANGLGGNTGVWKSTDGGQTWTNTTTSISTTAGFSDVALNPSNPQILYAAAGTNYGNAANGVYKSTDGGATWAASGNFPIGGTDGRIALAVAPSSPTTIYAAVVVSTSAANSGQLQAMEKSTDGGATWTALTSCPNFIVSGQGWYDVAVAVDPSNANIVYGAGVVDYANNNKLIVTSRDGGATWSDLTHDSTGAGPHTDIHALGFDAGGKLLLGGDGGFWRLDNATPGATKWADLNTNGLQITQFTGVALDPTDASIVYGGSQDNGTEKYTGNAAWSQIYGGDGGFVGVDPNNPQIMYTENFSISLVRSNDGGQTYTDATNGIGNDNANFYVPFALDPTTSGRLVLGTDHVYETTDYGADWTAIGTPGSGGFNATGSIIDALAISKTDPSTIYATGGGQVFATHNNGASWVSVFPTGAGDSFGGIAIDPTNASVAYLARSAFNNNNNHGEIFKTTDGGATWTSISGSGSTALPDRPTQSVAVGSINGVNYIWAGTDVGVYDSIDGGATWSKYLTGMPNVQVVSLEFNPALDILLAGTHGRGAWEIKPGSDLNITPTPPSGIVEEVPFTGQVATFTDITPSPVGSYSAEIYWGDGTSSAGTIQADPAGGFDIIGSTTYVLGGTYTATIDLTKTGSPPGSATVTESITVAADPIDTTAFPIQAVQAEPFSGEVADFVDTYPLATSASDYTASIDWGDGTTGVGTVVADGSGGFKVMGSTTFDIAGSYSAVVTITGLGGASATVDDPVSVLPAAAISPVPFSATIGEPFSGTVATFLSNDPTMPPASAFSASISWGDGSTSTGTVTLGAGGVYSVDSSKTYGQVGSDVVTVTVTDRFGAVNSAFETIVVADAPILASGVTFSAVEGAPYNGPVVTFTTPNSLATAAYFTAAILWGDGSSSTGTVVDDGGGSFEVDGLHTYVKANNFVTSVTIQDTAGQSVVTNGLARVGFATLNPVPLALTVVEGVSLSGIVGGFGDPDLYARSTDFTATISWGDGTTSAGNVLPSASGGFSVTGSKTYTSVGTYPVDIAVSEDGHPSTVIHSTVLVTASPLTAGGLPFTAVEGDATTPHLIAVFVDANTVVEPTSYYSATINWGDGTTSAGTIVAEPAGGFGVQGAHAYQAGTFPVFVQISSLAGASATASTTATVTPAPLTAGPPASIVVGEGSPVEQVLGTFSDANIYAPATNFTAAISWGDGTTGAGIITALGAGQFSVSGPVAVPHAYPAGTYRYSIKVVDYAGPTATLTGTATVTPAAIAAAGRAVSATEGVAFTALVATFTDAAPLVNPAGGFTVVINWGDGTSSAGSVTSPSLGEYQVTGGHDYAAGGSYVITTSIRSVGGATASATGSAAVASAPLTGSGLFFRPLEGVAYTGPVATFTDANPSHPSVRSFVAIISWGDKSQSIGTVSLDPTTGIYTVSGSHVYEAGNYIAAVSVGDTGGASTSATSPAYVAASAMVASPVAITSTEASAFDGTVATFTDADPRQLTPGRFQAAIYWGDGTVSSGTVAVVPAGYAVTGSHVYLSAGSYTVGVVVLSNGGASAATRTTATVAAAPISVAVGAITASQHVAFSGPVATFTDGDPFLPASNFSAKIAWGDGTIDDGQVVALAPGAFEVLGSHTFAEGGPSNVVVAVADSRGASASASSVVSVADQLYPISISLDPTTDSGVSNSDAITTVRTPLLEGTSEPGAVVTLFAERSPVDSMISIGTAQADASGRWAIQVGPLSDGSYALFAQAVDASGRPSTLLTNLPIDGRPALVIDNTPPDVVSTSYDPTTETIRVIYGDDLSGVSPLAITALSNYTLSAPFAKGAPTFSPTSIDNLYPGSAGLDQVVDVHFNIPARFRRGKLVLTLQGSGTTDLAGNVLVESHYIPLPSRGDTPGSVYQAQFTTNGTVSSGPQQYFSPAELRGVAAQRKLLQAKAAKHR